MQLATQVKSGCLVATSLLHGPSPPAAPAKASGSPAAAAIAPKAKAMPTIPLARATCGLPQAKPLVRKRGRVPDLDEALQATAAVVEQAKKEMKKANNLRRNAARRRQRYIAKAAKCSNEDLYKIAVYKRTDFLSHMIDHDPQGLQGAMRELLKNTSKESATAFLSDLAAETADLPSSGASASGSGGDGLRSDAGVRVAEEAAVTESTPLPVLPALAAPVQMPDGSEQFAVPTVDAEEQLVESREAAEAADE